MSKHKPTKSHAAARREFLKCAMLGGGAAALAVKAGGLAAAAPPQAGATEAGAAGPQGYHLTAHIRRYYETARQ